MIQDYHEAGLIFSVQDIKTPLVLMHIKMCEAALFSHDHATCEVCSVSPQGCLQVQNDIQWLMDKKELVVTREDKSVCVTIPGFNIPERIEVTYNSAKPAVTPLVICMPGPLPYTSQRAIPYKYEATTLEDGKEIPLHPLASVVNIVESSKVLRSGRILPTVIQGKTDALMVEPVQVQNSGKGKDVGQSSGKGYSD